MNPQKAILALPTSIPNAPPSSVAYCLQLPTSPTRTKQPSIEDSRLLQLLTPRPLSACGDRRRVLSLLSLLFEERLLSHCNPLTATGNKSRSRWVHCRGLSHLQHHHQVLVGTLLESEHHIKHHCSRTRLNKDEYRRFWSLTLEALCL